MRSRHLTGNFLFIFLVEMGDPYLYWTPIPGSMTASVIRFHPESKYPPKSIITGDYIFYCQEDISIEPGAVRAIYVDADITTFGRVTFVEFPIPGPSWYSPQMSHFYTVPSGYQRLFQLVRVRNIHSEPIVIKAGDPICRVLVDRDSIENDVYDTDDRIIANCMWVYRSVTTTEASTRGLDFYNKCKDAAWEPMPGPQYRIRDFTDMYTTSLSA